MDVLKYVFNMTQLIILFSHLCLQIRSLRPLVVSLFPGQQILLDQLKAQRIALSNELTDVINEFGPQLYEDFDEVHPQVICVGIRSSYEIFIVAHLSTFRERTAFRGSTRFMAKEERYRCC